jgi:D-cysteine desulfhydrase/L-cysteate sulfo-lyase
MSTALGSLDDLPRVTLGHGITPLEAMPNLARRFDNLGLFVKRDDCNGLAFGGNKVRQLEFYLGEAQAEGADTILITGAIQSNFVRLATAAARKLSMECHIQLEERVPKTDPLYLGSGNVLLDRVLGATIHVFPAGEDEAGADARLHEIAAGLTAEGRRPYVIPLAPGHKPLGALGYVVAARELLEQVHELGLVVDEIVVPSGSGNTHAGLLFGLRALGSSMPVTGICVRRPAALQRERIRSRVEEIAAVLGLAPQVTDADIVFRDEFLAPGYGQLNPATVDAIATVARSEGLILDPVYTGKTMAGFLQSAADGAAGRTLLFIHTGGTPALFAYGEALTEALGA